jgi:uncharacterized protein
MLPKRMPTRKWNTTVKLHLGDAPGLNLFTGYGENHLAINGARHAGSLLVLPDHIEPWSARDFDALTEADFRRLAGLDVEIVLLGSGKKQRFPPPAHTALLLSAGIGLEAMDTPAACRTFNILVAEGRKVAAAVIWGGDG